MNFDATAIQPGPFLTGMKAPDRKAVGRVMR